MRFIEKTFPVEFLNPIAMAEGNAKKPIYRMHKWWARRLGSVFRMITLSVFSSQRESEIAVWHKFCEGAELDGKIVLDPFMGGGTTVVEALRLGCKVIGVDINPVAWFLTKKEIEHVDLFALQAAFHHLEEIIGRMIKGYYRTKCPVGHEAEGMYFFWVKIAECSSCNATIKLFPNYELSRRCFANVYFCPRCLQIIKTAGYDPNTRCLDCGISFDPHKGVSRRGVFHCHHCGTKQRLLEAVRRKGTKLDVELHALEGYCKICGRFFKRADSYDVAILEKARVEFQQIKGNLLIPHQAIPTEGRSDPRPINHGYVYFWQMFNERQLLCLAKLLTEIMKLPDQNIREFMLIAFSDCLDTNNMFCKYETRWHKISVFFGLHAYHPIEHPTENNIWGTQLGRGTFVKCFEKILRAKQYCLQPYEPLLGEQVNLASYLTSSERIEGKLVKDFDELLQTARAALLRCDTSEDLSFIPDKSVDAIITDPPYFDNVQYSELADFFYVWLWLALKDEYPWFEPELSSRSCEILRNDRLGKTVDFFNESLLRVFKECHRVLKDDGLMVFTFHHNKKLAWQTIAQVLLDSGFYVAASPIVRSEGRSGFHSGEGNIRYDSVLVCRKQPSVLGEANWDSLKRQIIRDSIAWTQRTLNSGMPVNEVDVFTIVMAKTVECVTKAFRNPAHRCGAIDIAAALQEVEGIVGHVVEEAQASCKAVARLILF
jgi:putative DNA methylase